jgi:hypothetical protein
VFGGRGMKIYNPKAEYVTLKPNINAALGCMEGMQKCATRVTQCHVGKFSHPTHRFSRFASPSTRTLILVLQQCVSALVYCIDLA